MLARPGFPLSLSARLKAHTHPLPGIFFVQGVADYSIMSKALAKMFEPMFASMAKRYQATVGAELSKYGLRYDDLLDETANLDVAEALKRLPQEERDLRMQRLKRAMDLSMKHVYLDKDAQKTQTPFLWYLTPKLEEVEAERDERAALGTGQPYNRQIP
jgi:ubiquinol-cytochrome c reductase subunit 7